jgi:hypothetical protein
MIHRLYLSVRWKYYQVKRWFITESIELLAPGYQTFSEAMLGEVVHLRIENQRLKQELETATGFVVEGIKEIKRLKKSKRRKK